MVAALVLFCRSLIALVFLVSAVSKSRGRETYLAFEASLRDMRILPASAIRPVAALVLAGEVATVLTAWWPLISLPLAILLLSGFTVGIASVLRRGLSASCQCFGGSAAPFGRRHLVRNIALALVALGGLIGHLTGAEPTWTAAALALPAALVVTLIVVRLDDLVDLFSPAPIRR